MCSAAFRLRFAKASCQLLLLSATFCCCLRISFLHKSAASNPKVISYVSGGLGCAILFDLPIKVYDVASSYECVDLQHDAIDGKLSDLLKCQAFWFLFLNPLVFFVVVQIYLLHHVPIGVCDAGLTIDTDGIFDSLL